jgi:putative ABC transport system substrate-binding protein
VEGQNLAIEYRWAEGNNDRLPALAAELVRLHVDVIVTEGTVATHAARRATPPPPIIFAVAGDPLGAGLVASLARPGANVTGFAVMGSEMAAKRLELLREAVPGATRIAVIWNPDNPSPTPELRETQTTARALGIQIQSVQVREARTLDDAFVTVARERANAVVVLSDNMLFGEKKHIGSLAAQKRLPGIAWTREFADDGGLLMVYGPDVAEMHRRAADYVDRILKGAKPADLPVEQPTKFELVINLKTAKALGLTIPRSLLGRADEIIE